MGEPSGNRAAGLSPTVAPMVVGSGGIDADAVSAHLTGPTGYKYAGRQTDGLPEAVR